MLSEKKLAFSLKRALNTDVLIFFSKIEPPYHTDPSLTLFTLSGSEPINRLTDIGEKTINCRHASTRRNCQGKELGIL